MADETIVICGAASWYLDDVHTVCAWCGAAIVHRPHAPADAIKVCIPCAAERLDPERDRITATAETVREVLEFHKPKRTH